MKISFAVLSAHYPRKKDVDTAQLYESIGRPDLSHDMHWANTCAVRVSLALVGAGVAISPGHMTVKAGKHTGKRLEQGQARLSRFLVRALGAPEKFKRHAAKNAIGRRSGIVSFFKLGGETDNQGHIDIVAPGDGDKLACGNTCYWAATEIWFWPIK